MNSTKPIISADGGLIAALVLGALALVVLAASLRDVQGAAARDFGLAAAREASLLPVGAARDHRLDDAQRWLTEALATHGADPEIWGALAETRYFQATGAQVRAVSPALLSASLDAARNAVRFAPNDPGAHARLAAALSIIRGRGGEAAAALTQSYQLDPLNDELAVIRVEAAARLLRELDVATQTKSLGEACLARRAGAELNAAFATISSDPTCASQHRDSSPPGQ